MIVLGNAPSLQQDILNNRELFEKTELAVVNHFCHSEFFFQLKPKNYFLLDPAFFDQPFIESVEKTYHILSGSGDIDWEITFYIPWNSRKSYFVRGLKNKKNFKFQFVNYVTTKGGFWAVNRLLYHWNLAMPQSQNVLVYTLFLGVKMGVSRIFLFGAENNWHVNVHVNEENQLILQDNHLYEERKEITRKVLLGTSMIDLLESLLKAFKGYDLLERYARIKNVQIYNCSKNSFIDSFKRLDDDAFKKMFIQ